MFVEIQERRHELWEKISHQNACEVESVKFNGNLLNPSKQKLLTLATA